MSADLKKNYIINEDETEINIKDLLTYCFLHWRKALALMLIAGILLGGLMGGLEGMKTAKLAAAYQEYLDDPQALMAKQQNTIFAQKNGIVLPEDEMLTSEEQRILEEVATVDSINNLNDIITQSRRDLMTLTEYYNNSVLMTVTPQAVPTAEADIMITVPDGAPANAVNVLIAAYEDYLKNGNYLDVFSMEFDLDKTYLKELISITDMTFGNIDESSNQSGNRDITTDVDVNFSVTSGSDGSRVGLIIIKAIGRDEDMALAILDRILEEIDFYRDATIENVCDHTTTVVNLFINKINDERIQNLQTETSEQLVTLQENLEIYVRSLKNLQKQNDDLIVNSMNELPNAALEGTKTGVKFGAIAAVAAFLFYALVLVVRYIVSAIVLTKSQFINRFALFDLGSTRDGEAVLYKHNGKSDKKIRAKGRIGEDGRDAVKDAISNLAVYGTDIKSVLVIGTGYAVKGLKDQIKDKKVYTADSLTQDANARKLLLDVDSVILEVRYGITKFEDIKEQIELIELAGKPIAGYIAD